MAPFGTLYTIPGRVHPRTRKIFAAATLNGLELQVPSDFEPGETNKTPEFLNKFPLGKVPAFETPEGFKLVESSAIASYIAGQGSKRDQLLGATAEDRARNEQWILFNELHLETTAYTLAAWRMEIEEFDAKKEKAAAKDLVRWLDYYESHLAGRQWFINADGAGPSLADLTIGGTLFALYFVYVDAEMRPQYANILAFFERLKQTTGLMELYTGPMVDKRKACPN
ncbi:putative translation elongation factor eEF-1B gamma subunit [Truncatella angustata]|uniref:Translation elongation factor eEF-1B gamma subunit n=1 Tax=Truncatella angustata TaxID=152316 RepID=A0A9P9A1U3_9PEZI|nr:putative translation elongation factor eEF-1B gamma subunit [Truncatella angustata]KAH6657516.1 putative translation elongation factor eEF-1B gamma subunit [Truncatella angustata]KAH8197856.1 hypothetical protein TruAng_007955 [Truncatella angustata]